MIDNTPTGDAEFTRRADVLSELRAAVGKVDALAFVTLGFFLDDAAWSNTDQLQVERMAYLVAAVADAATAAVGTLDRLHVLIADQHQPLANEEW